MIYACFIIFGSQTVSRRLLGGISPVPQRLFGGLAALEVTTKDTVTDGDYSFDPLGFGAKGGMSTLKTAEIKHGRAAMMAITGFAVQEFFWGSPVVEQTPFFFKLLGGLL